MDAALNNFVALHYKAKHMSWLHCFWGIGVTAGPYIMGLCLTSGLRWNSGYQTIGVIQTVLVLCLLMTLSLWEKNQKDKSRAEQEKQALTLKEMLRLPGVKQALVGFFCYCSLEATTGLWASSYMVLQKGIDARTAAKWAAIFYLGITAGRFISGFITGKVGDKNMVRLGQALAGFADYHVFIGKHKCFSWINSDWGWLCTDLSQSVT